MTSNLKIHAAVALPGTITRTGWQLPAAMSRDDWIDYGRALDHIEGAVQWWLGDWWASGEGREWGDGEDLAEQAGINYSTARTYGSVARAFPLSCRLDKLTFTHHQEAMAAPSERRRWWLDRALKGDDGKPWSASQLRSAIKQDAARVKAIADHTEETAEKNKQRQAARAEALLHFGCQANRRRRVIYPDDDKVAAADEAPQASADRSKAEAQAERDDPSFAFLQLCQAWDHCGRDDQNRFRWEIDMRREERAVARSSVISVADRCAMHLRRLVLAAIKSPAPKDLPSLFAVLRDELDDLEKLESATTPAGEAEDGRLPDFLNRKLWAAP